MTTAWGGRGREDRIDSDCRNPGENGGVPAETVRVGNQGERFRRYSVSPCFPPQDLRTDWKLGARERFTGDTG